MPDRAVAFRAPDGIHFNILMPGNLTHHSLMAMNTIGLQVF
jgi:hypothetical protein